MNDATVLIKFKGDTKDIDGKLTGLNKSMGNLTKSFVAGNLISKGVTTAFRMISNSAGAAVKRIDTMNNFPKVMKNFGVSADEAKKSIDRIDQSVRGLPTSLDSAVAGVQNIFMATKNLPEAEKMFKAINDSAMVFAEGSTEAVNRFIYSYKQAMSSGKANAQDFNSMNDAIPGLMDKVASSMGITWSELKSGLSSGKISMDQFNTALKKLDTEGGAGMQSLEKAAKDATGGIQTAITNMKTAITRGVSEAFKALDKALKGAGLGGITDIIDKIGDGFEKVLKSIVPLIPPMVKFAQVLIKLAPLWAPIVAGLVAYSGAMKVAGKVTEFTDKLAGLPGIFGKIGSSAQNGVDGIKNFAKAHKGLALGLAGAGLAISGMVALYKKSGGDANKMAKMVEDKVNSIVDTVTKIAEKLPEIIPKVLPKILNAITTALPKIINSISKALPQVFTAVSQAIPKVIPILVNALVTIVTTLANMLPTFIPVLINGVVQLIMALVNALPTIIIALVNALPMVITSIVTGLIKCIPQLIMGAIQLVIGLVKALPQIIKSLIKAIPMIINEVVRALIQCGPQLITAGIQLIQDLWKGFKSWIGQMWVNVKNFAKQIPTKIKQGAGNLRSVGSTFLIDLWNGIKAKTGSVLSSIGNFAKLIPKRIKNGVGNLFSVGSNLIEGLWNGIKSKFDNVINRVSNLASKLPKAVRKVLGIASPSRVMFELGGYTTEGFMEGISSMSKALDKTIATTFSLSPNVTGSMNNHFSPNVNITNNVDVSTDPLGQTVNKIKTFAGGAKNDYNYGLGA